MRALLIMLLTCLLLGPSSIAQAAGAADKFLAARLAAQVDLAEQGDVEAQMNVAVAYQHGSGVKKDLDEAMRWYGAAAAQGNAEAMWRLGSIIRSKFEPEDTSPEAMANAEVWLDWFHRAAAAGEAGAQNSLGLAYGLGGEVEIDLVRGRMWLFVAEANGHVMQGSLIDRIEKQMSGDEIASARSRAEACTAASFANCD